MCIGVHLFIVEIKLLLFNTFFLGLANLFPGTSQNRTNNSEQEQINEIYQKHINEHIASQYGKIEDWNDIRQKEGEL